MICELVSRRAGFMAAAGVSLNTSKMPSSPFFFTPTLFQIAALLKKMDYHDVVVAIDGSVFRYHPHFPNIMRSRISQLVISVKQPPKSESKS